VDIRRPRLDGGIPAAGFLNLQPLVRDPQSMAQRSTVRISSSSRRPTVWRSCSQCQRGAGLPSWSTSKTRCPTGSRCRMSHGPFQEPFTGQKPFGKRPDPPRARDGPGLATCTSAYSANDQLTNAVACAWFELHPNLRYIKYKVAEPDQV
jgi:hypothetical protein